MGRTDLINVDMLSGYKHLIAAGDAGAFRHLFDLFAERLTYFAFSITKDRDASIQIMDEVFVKIWKNPARLAEVDNLTTYLYTAVKNTALNYLSKKANETITKPLDYVDIALGTNETPEQSMISSEIFRKIQEAVNSLPPKCKIIFKLVREDGLKYKDVAEILNISVNTVDAQMVIAVRKITEKVKNHFEKFPDKAVKKS